MPFVQLKHCSVEGDIAQAYLDMQQRVSDVTQSILGQITGLTTPDLSGLNNALAQLLVASPTPLSPDQLATQIGLPPLQPSDQENETRLTALGIILIKQIMYLADTSGNVAAYRRLYFAVGGDMTRFLSIVNGTAPFALIQTYLRVEKLPATRQWTLTAARALYQNDAIEAIYLASDTAQYVVIPTFLAINQSGDQAAREANVPRAQVVSQMFWLREISQTPMTLQNLQSMGITGDYLAAALFGANLTDFNPNILAQSKADVSVQTGQAISQLQLLIDRFQQTVPADRLTYRAEGNRSTLQAQALIYAQQQAVRFNATVLTRPEDISDFLTRNSQEDLAYLFSKRLDVTGINFTATQADIMQKISQALAVPAGSTTLSSLLLNNPAPTIPNTIDTCNGSLVRNVCANLQLTLPQTVLYDDLQTALSCLQQSLQSVPVPTPSTTPIQGYPSWDSPAMTIAQQVDFGQTLNQQSLIDAIEQDFVGFSFVLTAIISVITAMIKFVQNAINQIFNSFKQTVGGFLNQLQSTVSHFNSFFGTKTLDLSILKCVSSLPQLGLNIDGALIGITQLVDAIQKSLLELLGKVSKAIGDLIAELLCFIPNLLNTFITGIPNPIPSICQVNKVTLPQNVTDALNQLRQGFLLQGSTASAFSRDALKLTAYIQQMPNTLKQFQENLACENTGSDAFTAASKQLLGILTIPNPLATIGGAF